MNEPLCGMDEPDDYISSGSSVDLRFFSDSSVTRKGFKATYQSECGGNLTGKSLKNIIFGITPMVTPYKNLI